MLLIPPHGNNMPVSNAAFGFGFGSAALRFSRCWQLWRALYGLLAGLQHLLPSFLPSFSTACTMPPKLQPPSPPHFLPSSSSILLVVFFFCLLHAPADPAALSHWPDRDRYYYSSYEQKISEIGTGCPFQILPPVNHTTESTYSFPSNASQVYLIPTPASPQLVDWFLSIPPPRQMRVNPDLCSIPYSYKKPIFNNSGCQLRHYMSPYAPRCQSAQIRDTCLQAQQEVEDSTATGFILPESNHSMWASHLPPQPYLLAVRKGYATMCGQASLACGYVHPSTNCHTTGYRSQIMRFHRQCTPWHDLQARHQPVFECGKNTPFSRNVTRVGRVFVVAQVDDTYTYHIHLEIVPRLVYHLPFLKANPDVHILYGCDVKKSAALTSQGLRKGLQSLRGMLAYFNITNPLLVQRHVHSDTALYLPMEGACQDPVFNAWHILYMRQLVLDRWTRAEPAAAAPHAAPSASPPFPAHPSNPPSAAPPPPPPPRPPLRRLVLLTRSSTSRYTRNNADLVRQWDGRFVSRLTRALQAALSGRLAVQVLSDQDAAHMACYRCQVDLLARASVLVGMHGAGLGLMVYMPPNSAVVEIAPYGNDGRCLPGAGPFSRAAALLGHNYLIHYPRYQEFTWKSREKTAEFNVTRFTTHVLSFLKAIDFV